MTDSIRILKTTFAERIVWGLGFVLVGASLACAGWFGHSLWTQNAFAEREAQLNTYEIQLQQWAAQAEEERETQLNTYEVQLQQWATQAANEAFAAKRQALVNELYNQPCVIPAGFLGLVGERTGLLINGVCYLPTDYGVPSQISPEIPAPPEPQ